MARMEPPSFVVVSLHLLQRLQPRVIILENADAGGSHRDEVDIDAFND
jgi:hypothetical protein